MILKSNIFYFGLLLACFLATAFSSGIISEPSENAKQEYKQELSNIKIMRDSLRPGRVNNLEEYEKFAAEIQKKWIPKNREHYARLMLEVCKPLSSGQFSGERQYDVARKYALSALDKPEEISIEMELELVGHVVTLMYTPNSPKGGDFTKRRKKDVEIRLHAWKRLIDAIDPNWDPNEVLLSPNAVAASMGFPGTIAPESIKNTKLRAEYEAAIEKNRQKAERYNEQYRLRNWLKRFPKRAEEYIILAYSEPPFNLVELKLYLDKYIADEKTRSRILEIVKKNMAEHPEKTLKEQAKEPPANSSKS